MMFNYDYRGENVLVGDAEGSEAIRWGSQNFTTQEEAHVAITSFVISMGRDSKTISIMKMIKDTIREGDIYDPWGTCCGWMFSLGEWMGEHYRAKPPYEFHSAMFGIDDDAHEYQSLTYLNPTEGECYELANLLNRWYSIIKARGDDY